MTAMETAADRATIGAVNLREKRLGLNEAVLREVNERITGEAVQVGRARTPRPRLRMPGRDLYTANRDNAGRVQSASGGRHTVALYPGQADPEIERVISSHKGYEVVAKQGDAAEVALDLSSR